MSESEFENCIKKNQIRKDSQALKFIDKEVKQARVDLECANASFVSNNFKWTIIQCYYSMFYSARSLLYLAGYREKSHYCLIASLRALYVSEGKLSYKQVEALQLAKTLRENADYYGNFDKNSAENLIKEAGDFLEISLRIIKDQK